MRRMLRDNGLSIALFTLVLLSLVGQILAGLKQYNQDRQQHGYSRVSYTEYLGSGHFIEAVFENWESEFLQMAIFVVLTVFLYQKGSSESKRPGVPEAVDIDPRRSLDKTEAPYPVRRGGWLLKLYEYSLSIVLFLLFLLSFLLHATGGARQFNLEQEMQHQPEQVSIFGYMMTSRFWFESFQNWQSEFLSIGVMIALTIFLRQKGSPQSKPVESSHRETEA